MPKLHFKYEMKIEYTIPVARCHFTIKCMPKDTKRQLIDNVDISMIPPTRYEIGEDGFCNGQIYGLNAVPHSMFYFTIEGDATTGMAEYEEDTKADLDMMFSHPYGLNKPGDDIISYFEEHPLDADKNSYEKAVQMMHQLHKDMVYEPGTTDKFTTAQQAIKQRKGVCQDYAHILISLMHLAKIPARYVTGLIVGEGASHAWVEILYNGKWYGIDPTNDKIVSDEHIKIGVGRDANDCQINRGIMFGGGFHVQTINVSVYKTQ